MNKYNQIVEWLCSYWLTALILFGLIVLMSIPKVRDGAVLLWSWMRRPFIKKRDDGTAEIVLRTDEETVTFTELLRSVQHDVVKVHAHTHILGVAAEHEWVRRRYPESEFVQQTLTTLDLIAGNKKYKSSQIHFDIIEISLPRGRHKEIYFDISSFFGGGVSSHLDPQAFIAKKIAQLYE